MGKRGSKPVKVADVLKGVLAARGMAGSTELASLRAGWETAVGKAVSGHAVPDMIKGGLLTVVVDSSVWMNQLSMLSPEIIDKVNALLGGGKVEDIKFRIGKVGGDTPAKQDAPFKPRKRALGPEEKAAVEESVRPIKDAEVRERARRLLTADLSRKV